MFGLWAAVGRGEIVDKDGTTHWSIEWPALSVALEIEHGLIGDDDPAEVFDALLLIRNELNNHNDSALRPIDVD